MQRAPRNIRIDVFVYNVRRVGGEDGGFAEMEIKGKSPRNRRMHGCNVYEIYDDCKDRKEGKSQLLKRE